MTVTISLVLQSVVGVSGERPRSASEVNQYLNRNFFSDQRSRSEGKEPDSTSTLRGKVGFLLSSVTNSGRTGICKNVMTVAISLVLQSVVGVSGNPL